MRLGQLTKVPVNDEVTIMVKIDWGQYKKLLAEIDALRDDDRDALEALGAAICPFIHSIAGVEDAQGNAIEQVTPEVLNTFPPDLARDLMTAIIKIGQQSGGGVVPPVGDTGS